jgi:hypothetical protein
MSTIEEPGATRTHSTPTQSTDVRGPATDSFRRQSIHETRPSFMTSEFWAMIIGVGALIILYNVSDEPTLTLWRTCVLATALAVGYFVSRGLAKSGSRREERWYPRGRDAERY